MNLAGVFPEILFGFRHPRFCPRLTRGGGSSNRHGRVKAPRQEFAASLLRHQPGEQNQPAQDCRTAKADDIQMSGRLSRSGAIGCWSRADRPHIARFVMKKTYKAAGLVFPKSPGIHGFFQDNTAPPELFNLDAAFQFGRKFFHNSNLRRNRASAGIQGFVYPIYFV